MGKFTATALTALGILAAGTVAYYVPGTRPVSERVGIGWLIDQFDNDTTGTVDPEMAPVTTTMPAPFRAARYVTTIKPTSPCAMSFRTARAEDDVCSAWFDRNGRIHIGPMSDAPAYANFVG